MNLVDKYQDQHLTNRVFDLAWTHSLVVLRQLNATETDAQLFGRLAGSVLYANGYLRSDEAILSKNQSGQSGLWGYAISGDLPIVLLQISDAGNIGPGAATGASPRLLARQGARRRSGDLE